MTIKARGQKCFAIRTQEGLLRSVCAQVTDVNKNLLSVSQMCSKKHRVVFDPEVSYIEDRKSGERIGLTESNGTYYFTCYARSVGGTMEVVGPGFTGQR